MKILPVIASATLLFTGCSAMRGLLTTSTIQELRPASTNVVPVTVTNYVSETRYVTNLVTVVEQATNAATGIVTPAVVQPQILPVVTVQATITTNFITQVTPAVLFTNMAISPAVLGGVQMAGDVAPVPWGGMAAGIIGAVGTLVMGYFNNRNKKKAIDEADKKDTALSALDQAMIVGKTLVDNVETIRKAALTVPGYAAKDAQVMKVVEQVQRAAGVKSDIHDLVETHTDETTPPTSTVA